MPTHGTPDVPGDKRVEDLSASSVIDNLMKMQSSWLFVDFYIFVTSRVNFDFVN